MAESTGKFTLVDGDDDNFDKIMVAIGISEEHRKLSRNSKPTMEMIKEGDGKFKSIVSTPGLPEAVKHITVGVEQEENALGGRKVKSTYTIEGKRMIHHEKQADGQVVIYDREIKGDEMHVKVTCGSLVANRLYKKN